MLKKTSTPVINRVIEEIERDEKTLNEHCKNLDGIQAIRRDIKREKPPAK